MVFRLANAWNNDNLALDQEHVDTSLGTVELFTEDITNIHDRKSTISSQQALSR